MLYVVSQHDLSMRLFDRAYPLIMISGGVDMVENRSSSLISIFTDWKKKSKHTGKINGRKKNADPRIRAWGYLLGYLRKQADTAHFV